MYSNIPENLWKTRDIWEGGPSKNHDMSRGGRGVKKWPKKGHVVCVRPLNNGILTCETHFLLRAVRNYLALRRWESGFNERLRSKLNKEKVMRNRRKVADSWNHQVAAHVSGWHAWKTMRRFSDIHLRYSLLKLVIVTWWHLYRQYYYKRLRNRWARLEGDKTIIWHAAIRNWREHFRRDPWIAGSAPDGTAFPQTDTNTLVERSPRCVVARMQKWG